MAQAQEINYQEIVKQLKELVVKGHDMKKKAEDDSEIQKALGYLDGVFDAMSKIGDLL